MNEPLTYRPGKVEWDDIERGEFCYWRADDGRVKHIYFWPRDCPAPMLIPITPEKTEAGATWALSGTEGLPTLHPSVNWVGQWHGWLVAGVATGGAG